MLYSDNSPEMNYFKEGTWNRQRERQTDGRIAASLNAPYYAGNESVPIRLVQCQFPGLAIPNANAKI